MPKIRITHRYTFLEYFDLEVTNEEIEHRETRWDWPDRWIEESENCVNKTLGKLHNLGIPDVECDDLWIEDLED